MKSFILLVLCLSLCRCSHSTYLIGRVILRRQEVQSFECVGGNGCHEAEQISQLDCRRLGGKLWECLPNQPGIGARCRNCSVVSNIVVVCGDTYLSEDLIDPSQCQVKFHLHCRWDEYSIGAAIVDLFVNIWNSIASITTHILTSHQWRSVTWWPYRNDKYASVPSTVLNTAHFIMEPLVIVEQKTVANYFGIDRILTPLDVIFIFTMISVNTLFLISLCLIAIPRRKELTNIKPVVSSTGESLVIPSGCKLINCQYQTKPDSKTLSIWHKFMDIFANHGKNQPNTIDVQIAAERLDVDHPVYYTMTLIINDACYPINDSPIRKLLKEDTLKDWSFQMKNAQFIVKLVTVQYDSTPSVSSTEIESEIAEKSALVKEF